MPKATCPNCDAVVSPEEAADGWCESCGKKLPAGIVAPAQGKRPSRERDDRDRDDRDRDDRDRDDDDREERRPRRRRRSRGDGEFAPCPNCDSGRATKVGFTWWGGILGPRLFSHVKCNDCGTTFNGKTGKSNNGAIAIYVIVSAVIVIAILALAANA